MVALDTNVVLRVLIYDDPLQCARAERAWAQAIMQGGVFIATTVVVELAWVMRAACKLDRRSIATHLRALFDAEHVSLEAEQAVRRALYSYEQGSADLSDCLILESARTSSALPVMTFDERFSRHAGAMLVDPGTPL